MHALRRRAPSTTDTSTVPVARAARLLGLLFVVMGAFAWVLGGVDGAVAHAQDDAPVGSDAADSDTGVGDVLVPGTPPTAASNGAPTTLEAVVETERQADNASRTVSLIIAALLTIALILTLCTFLYWHRTRPEQPDRPNAGRTKPATGASESAAAAAKDSTASVSQRGGAKPSEATKTKTAKTASAATAAKASKPPRTGTTGTTGAAPAKKKTAPKTIPKKRNDNQPEQAPHLKEAAEKRAAQKQLAGSDTTTEMHRAEIGER